METLTSNLNERMIKFVDSKKSLISKIIFGIILIIPIAITFIIAVSLSSKGGSDTEEKTKLGKDDNRDLYAARDDSGTKKVNLEDSTINKLDDMFDEAVK